MAVAREFAEDAESAPQLAARGRRGGSIQFLPVKLDLMGLVLGQRCAHTASFTPQQPSSELCCNWLRR